MVCECFDIDSPPSIVLSQIKNYKKNLGFTDGGIGYTLWYMKNILEEQFNAKYGIYRVKEEYKNAENYYLQQDALSEKISQFTEKERIVKFKSKKQSAEKFLINIDDLLKGGE